MGELEPAAQSGHDPVFQLVFGLNTQQEVLSLGALGIEWWTRSAMLAKVDVELSVLERREGLGIGWTYRRELFEAGSMERLAHSYEQLLRGIVAQPARGVFEYELVAGSERTQLVEQGGGPLREYPLICIHEQIEAQCARTPDAMAVSSASGTLSYRQLNERAARLSRYLIESGVRVDTRVGICLERSTEQLIAILGVLKAGGTYVPLDIELPEQRMAYVLADAQIERVLVSGVALERLPLTQVDVC